MTPPAQPFPSSAEDHPETLVVRGPESLPVVVPHLMGFVPYRSFVVLGHQADGRTPAVTMRFDIPPAGLPDDELVQALGVWSSAFEAMDQAGATSATVVIYPGEPGERWSDVIIDELPYRELAELLEAMLVAAEYAVREMVCVVGDRMRSYLCDDLVCCPPQGRALDESERLRIEATLVGRGSAPLRSRQALVDSLDARPDDDPVRVAVLHARPGALARQSSDVVEDVESFLLAVARWDRTRDGGAKRFTRLVATAGLLVTDIAPRDYLLRELAVECDGPGLRAVRTVLAEAVRCACDPEVAPLAAVLGVCAWMSGDGAAARVALERSLAADPAYSLAHLVTTALDGGIPPWSWRESMRDLTAEAILAAARPGQARSPA